MKLKPVLALTVLTLLVPAVALAQATPAVAPMPTTLNPAELTAVCTGAYAILNALASAMRADNTALSWAPPVLQRVAVVCIGGSIQAALLLVTTGTPWYVVLPAAAFTTYAAWMTSGKRVTPGTTPAAAAVEKSSGRPPPATPTYPA